MTTYFFIGDGSEVLACESYLENAQAELARLQEKTCDTLSVYECDPCEIIRDDSAAEGCYVWQHPSERAVAEADYDLPSLDEVIQRDADSELDKLAAFERRVENGSRELNAERFAAALGLDGDWDWSEVKTLVEGGEWTVDEIDTAAFRSVNS